METATMQQYPTDPSPQQLADLLHHGLKLSTEARQQHPNPLDLARPIYPPDPEPEPPQIKYSISQHYTHTAHIAPALHPLHPSPNDHAGRLLIQNDIAPSSLLRSQFELFERASADQQAKLVMLWRLAPPNHGRHGGQELADRVGEYQSTTVEREEELAWLRYQSIFGGRDARRDVEAEKVCGRESPLWKFYGSREEKGMVGLEVSRGELSEIGRQGYEERNGQGWRNDDEMEDVLQ